MNIAIGIMLWLLLFNASADDRTAAAWLQEKISALQAAPVRNPPAAIIKKIWAQRIYYYLPAPCCDQMSALHDWTGRFICSPDGGFTGKGDGRCPAFVHQLGVGDVIWRDPR